MSHQHVINDGHGNLSFYSQDDMVTHVSLDNPKMASKEEFDKLKARFDTLGEDIVVLVESAVKRHLDERFAKYEERLDKIEGYIKYTNRKRFEGFEAAREKLKKELDE